MEFKDLTSRKAEAGLSPLTAAGDIVNGFLMLEARAAHDRLINELVPCRWREELIYSNRLVGKSFDWGPKKTEILDLTTYIAIMRQVKADRVRCDSC